MTGLNRRITLASRPVGLPEVSDFRLEYSPLSAPGVGEVLVRPVYLALDPALRTRMDAAASGSRPLTLGEVMPCDGVAVVVRSEDPRLLPGDWIEGMTGWQEYAVVVARGLRRLDAGLSPVSAALGVLGAPGLTAYFGLLELCEPRRRETVVVSDAAGAVGMIAGQIAQLRGCRVVGVTDTDAKISWLVDELGFDAAVSDRLAADLQDALRQSCPRGIDAYFDNVGGVTTDTVLTQLNSGARIALCGQRSQLNLRAPESGPRWLDQMIARSARMQGFLLATHTESFPEGYRRLASWLRRGKVRIHEDVAQGIEAAPQAFIGMLQGEGRGQQLVQLF